MNQNNDTIQFQKGDTIEVLGKNKDYGAVYANYVVGTVGIVEKAWIGGKDGIQWVKVFWGKNAGGQKLVGSIPAMYVQKKGNDNRLKKIVEKWQPYFLAAIPIQLNDQILASKNQGIFVGRVVEIREKAIKVDYCWESVWGNISVNVYTYTTWMPKSVIVDEGKAGLTIKKWFINKGLDPQKIFKIKKYWIDNGKKIYL